MICQICSEAFEDASAFATHQKQCRVAPERMLNESAIRQHALRCSKQYRAGKFTRVGEDFITEVQIDVEHLVRNIKNQNATLHPPLYPDVDFTTGALMNKIEIQLNGLVARLIQSKVQKQPSCGCTLGRTR